MHIYPCGTDDSFWRSDPTNPTLLNTRATTYDRKCCIEAYKLHVNILLTQDISVGKKVKVAECLLCWRVPSAIPELLRNTMGQLLLIMSWVPAPCIVLKICVETKCQKYKKK